MVYYTPPAGTGRWYSSSTQGSWQVVGGTSVGAPAWAGIIAIVDQGRTVAGLSDPNLTGATQTLPALYSLASSNSTSGDFHSVASSPTGTPWSGGGGFGFPGAGSAAGDRAPAPECRCDLRHYGEHADRPGHAERNHADQRPGGQYHHDAVA